MGPGGPGTLGGKDSGIVTLHCGTHGTCPGCTSGSRDSGTGRTVGCGTFMSPMQHRSLGTFLNISCKIGPA